MPYAALAGVLAGLLNQRGLPTLNTGELSGIVDQNQQQNQQLINQMPVEIQNLLKQYVANGANAANTLNTTTGQIGQNLLNSTTNLYGPNTDAVKATLAALKQQDYSTLPDTLNNLKSQLAATGGLNRGGAATAITKAVLAPATQFSGQSANVEAQQLNAQQQNVQQALNKIASLDDATAQQIFGMSKEQANQILQTGNEATRTQLADLINNNNAATASKLGIGGLNVNNAYQNAVAQNSDQSAIINGLVNAGAQGAQNYFSNGSTGGNTGLPSGADVSSPDYITNSNNNNPNYWQNQ